MILFLFYFKGIAYKNIQYSINLTMYVLLHTAFRTESKYIFGNGFQNLYLVFGESQIF